MGGFTTNGNLRTELGEEKRKDPQNVLKGWGRYRDSVMEGTDEKLIIYSKKTSRSTLIESAVYFEKYYPGTDN